MKKNIKIGILSSLILTPVAVTIAEQPVFADSAEQQKVFKDFANLNMSTSMVDYDLYKSNLDKAFTAGSEVHTLLLQKLDYINSYNKQKKAADDLKTEISKLTLTNKTLFKDYEEAYRKYVLIRDEIYKINNALANAETEAAKGALSSFEAILPENSGGVLGNVKAYYEQPASKIVADLIGVNNQNLLAERGTQIQNIQAKTGGKNYIDLVEAIYKATSKDNYKTNIDKAKEAYSKFTTVEKTIADKQLINGTTVTNKQAMTDAENNIAKAAAFDQNIISINPDFSTLKTQLIALDKAYNALTPMQKLLISEASSKIVTPLQEILKISGQIGALKADNTEQYRTALEEIQGKITGFQLTTIGQVEITKDNVESIIPNIEKFTAAKEDIKAIEPVETKILVLKGTATPSLKDIQDARSAYNALSSNLKKLVRNLSYLTDLESADKDAIAVVKKIDAIKVSNKADFYKRYIEAQSAYDTLKNKDYVTNEARLLTLAPYAKLVNDFSLLNPKAEGYDKQVEDLLDILKTDWIDTEIDSKTSLTPEDKQQLKLVRELLKDRSSATDKAQILVGNIDALTPEDSGLLQNIMLYRMTYNELDATAKKLVTNIKKLTDYEKTNKAAVDVMKLVDSLDPLSPKFVNSAVAARKAYNKLNSSLKSLITDSEKQLVKMEKISSVMQEINNLKNSKEILVDVEKARQAYTTLLGNTNDDKLIAILKETYAPQLVLAEARNEAIVDTVQAISGLGNEKDYRIIGGTIQTVSTMYKSLSSNDKKLVTNYSAFKDIEKDYKVASKAISLIEKLPSKEADDYTKKVEAALKAYRNLTDAQKKYVYNYESDLSPVVGVASLIGDIDSIKTSMKDFTLFISKLRTRYNELSPAEKAQVHNYQKLEAAEQALNGATNVIQLIQAARPGVANYLDALQKARDAYDMLSSDQKKQVTNYKDLQNREKQLKPILDLNDLILKIGSQSSAKNFISNYEKAWKELDKVSLQERALLSNEKLLTQTYVPLYNVMSRIESIKSSSKTFVDDVKATRAAYEALSADQKAKILNEGLLREHEVNVQGGAYVDTLIRALKTNPPAVYVQKVQEADEAYKKLSSANKKAVTLYDELKVELKYIAPVVQAIQAIDLLETSGGKLDAQVKKVNSILAKLTDEQYALIPNMAKLNNLGNVIKVVTLIELIKPSDTRYYMGNTKAAEIAYNRLSPDEKQKVTNYSKLEEALLNVAALDQITRKISELSSLSPTYVSDVKILLDEYKKLPSALKKQVSNYSQLERAEKDINSADKVIHAIAAIDPNVRTFESKVIAARKQYDKLTDDQKTLVTNARLLLQYERDLGL